MEGGGILSLGGNFFQFEGYFLFLLHVVVALKWVHLFV